MIFNVSDNFESICKLPLFPGHSKLEFLFLVILGKRINKKLVEHFLTIHEVFRSYNLAAILQPLSGLHVNCKINKHLVVLFLKTHCFVQ
jgi:hypothetical protein